MKYWVQRCDDPTSWANLPADFYGMGNIEFFKAYDLPEFAVAAYIPETGPRVPIYSFIAYRYTDGKAGVRMMRAWNTGKVIDMNLNFPRDKTKLETDEAADLSSQIAASVVNDKLSRKGKSFSKLHIQYCVLPRGSRADLKQPSYQVQRISEDQGARPNRARLAASV
jgi:hypothetical protein